MVDDPGYAEGGRLCRSGVSVRDAGSPGSCGMAGWLDELARRVGVLEHVVSGDERVTVAITDEQVRDALEVFLRAGGLNAPGEAMRAALGVVR